MKRMHEKVGPPDDASAQHEKKGDVYAPHELEAPSVPIEMPVGNESVEMEAEYVAPAKRSPQEFPKEDLAVGPENSQSPAVSLESTLM